MSENKLTVGELVYKISGDMDNLKTELKKADTEIKKIQQSVEKNNKSVGKMTAGFGLLKTAVIGFISGALVRGTMELAKSGAELDSLTGSFNRLASEAGVSSSAVLDTLREFSAGTISNRDLITSANRAMVLGVAKSTEEFGTLMQVARIRAADMGLSTQQAFNDIVTGIGRSSPLILDNLGIVIKQNEAYDSYAKSLGKATEALTENEKREALKFAVLEAGRKQIESVGEVTVSYSERIQQATASIQNMRDRIGLSLLPAMEVLFKNLTSAGESSDVLAEKTNSLGKFFYRLANIISLVATGIKEGFVGIRIIWNGLQNTIVTGAIVIVNALRLAAKAVGKDTQIFDDALADLSNSIEENQDDISDALKDSEENAKKAGEALKEAFFAEDFKGVTAETIDQIKAASQALGDELAPTVDDTGEKIEEFQSKLLGLAKSAGEVKKELEGKLGDAFTEFSESLKSNFEESVSSLAQIVIGAEEKIKSLKDQLKDTEDTDERKDLKKQIKEQEEILKSREDFEERQAERITAIRTKLEEAGIDATKAGLDSILNVRTLEEQIEEEKRLASLDEFQRFEEQQSRKLVLLTDAFITEATLLQEKIATQKEYEADLTNYLLSEESKRLAGTEDWAQATIAKYEQVADSLKSLLSTQAQIKNLQVGAISPVSPSSVVQTPQNNQTQAGGTTNNNSTNISAPVTINGQNVNNLSAQEISAIMGFELNKYIR